MLILSSRNRCRRALRESISTPASEMNEPGMRSPAGYRARARACLVSCLLVSGFSGPERRLFAAWRPGVIPGAYMPLQRLRFRRTDSQMPPAPAQATRGDPASCNAYQVAGECDGIIRRPGRGITPPVLPWCRRCRFRLHFFLPALPFVRGLAFLLARPSAAWRGVRAGSAFAPPRVARARASCALCQRADAHALGSVVYTYKYAHLPKYTCTFGRAFHIRSAP